MLQFVDDPHLRNEARCCPVQLPLAVSGWVFKEEFEEDAKIKGVKVEKCAEDEKMNMESSDTAVTGETDGRDGRRRREERDGWMRWERERARGGARTDRPALLLHCFVFYSLTFIFFLPSQTGAS